MKKINSNYCVEAKRYEREIDLAIKREYGIFYTDFQLAETMIKELNIEKNSIILDPCCGTGIFLEAATQNGYEKVFGCDIDKKAVSICNKKFGNVVVCDSIFDGHQRTLEKLSLSNGADYIIGNPPYAVLGPKRFDNSNAISVLIKNHGNNLFVGSIIQSLSMLKKNGILSYIIPKNFLHVDVYSELRKEILRNYDILEIVDIGAHFSNVRGEQVVFTIQKKKTPKNSIKFMSYFDGVLKVMCRISQDFYNDEIMIFNSKEDFLVYKKLSGNNETLQEYKDIRIHRGRSRSVNAIRGRDIRKYGFKDNRAINHGNQLFMQNIYSAESGSIATFAGDLEASETVTVLSSNNSINCKLILALLHSSIWNMYLYKYCYNSSKLTMHTDAKYLYKIPMPNKKILGEQEGAIIKCVDELENEEYMSDRWLQVYRELDNTIYMVYDMNKYETLYINSEVKKVQSKRWKL